MPFDHTIGHTGHSKEAIFLQVYFSTDLGSKSIHDIAFHKWIVQRMTTIRSAEVRIAIVDLHVTNFNSGQFHQVIPEFTFEWQFIKLDITAFYPGFVVVTGREISCQIKAN